MTDQPNTSPIRLCVMQGDGIGPEITAATLDVLRAAAAKWQIEFAFDQVEVGLKPLSLKGTTFPDASFEAAKAADGVILGPVSHNDYPPADKGGINPSGALRKRLDLFANIRPARTRADFPPRCGKPVDLVIVRENTEGFYADRNMFLGSGEMMPTPDLALSMRKITREGSTRIVEEAFRLALRRRQHVTAVHKANVLRVSDGLFLECARAVAARYPQVALRGEDHRRDGGAAGARRQRLRRDRHHQHVRRHSLRRSLRDRRQPRPRRVDQLPAPITRWRRRSTARRRTSPDRTRPIPSSLIGSAAMLLAWLGERRDDARLLQAAEGIERALDAVIAVPEWRTGDLGGPLGTRAFGEKVVEALNG